MTNRVKNYHIKSALMTSLVILDLALAQLDYTAVATGDVVTDQGYFRGSSWGDYDNDGDQDLFVVNYGGTNILYNNDGLGEFVNVTSGTMVSEISNFLNASWGDMDNDGDLDLFVASYSTPETNTNENYLYENNGDGSFTKVMSGEIVSDDGYSFGSSWGDMDNDGDLDLFVANNGNNFLYENDGSGNFSRVTDGEMVNDESQSTSASWGDMDNDGDLDIFVTNTGGQSNELYENNGDGSFIKITDGNLVNETGYFESSSWVDYDNDGDLDLFIIDPTANNLFYVNNGDGTFIKNENFNFLDTPAIPTSYAWGDMDNDGDQDLFFAGYILQSDNSVVYVHRIYNYNPGSSFFSLLSLDWAQYAVTSVSLSDYNNDGGLDIFTTNTDGSNDLYYNSVPLNNWVNIELSSLNSQIIGTKVRCKAVIDGAETWQFNELSGQTSTRSQNSLNAEFGLLNASIIDSITIETVLGSEYTFTDVSVNQFLSYTFDDIIFSQYNGDLTIENGSNFCWSDHDNDGDQDIFIVNNGSYNSLYSNNGDGTFTNITDETIVNDGGNSTVASWGDYDRNGYPDLFVANNGNNFLYANNGDGSFTKITEGDIVNDNTNSIHASWSDYDNDGYLDLFVVNSGSDNALYHNNGDGSFTSIMAIGIVTESNSNSASWSDYDNDSDQDIFLANNGNNSLYRNNGDGSFTEVNEGVIIDDNANSIHASWCDYDNDGYLDLFVANSGSDNQLFHNNDGSFTNVTEAANINYSGHSSSSSWGDYDNDGDPDLLVTTIGNNDYNILYNNNGTGSFTHINAGEIAVGHATSISSSWVDFNNDGDLDAFVSNDSDQNFFYNNNGNSNSWTSIYLTETQIIGSRIRVKIAVDGSHVWQMKEVSSQNNQNLVFGLGNASTIDSIIVHWPTGLQRVLVNQSVNQVITIPYDPTLPVIMDHSINPVQPGILDEITVTALINEGETGIETSTLYFNIGGTSDYESLEMSGSNGLYTGTIPGEKVTATGLYYYVVVDIPTGVSLMSDTVGVSVNFGSGYLSMGSVENSAYPTGLPMDKWRIFSLPAQLDDNSLYLVINDDLGAQDDTIWRLFQFGSSSQSYNENPAYLVLGESFWIYQRKEEDLIINLPSGKTGSMDGTSLNMKPGWNFIGSPYPFPINLDLDQNIFYGPVTYGLNAEEWSDVVSNIDPWGGYAVYNRTGSDKIIILDPNNTNDVLTARVNDELGWQVNISVTSDQYRDRYNRFGCLETADDALDWHDNPEISSPGNGVSLFFKVEEEAPDFEITSDIRSLDQDLKVWDAFIRSNTGSDVNLSWSIVQEPNFDIDIRLVDLNTRKVIDLKNEQQLELGMVALRYNRRMKIIAGEGSDVATRINDVLSIIPLELSIDGNYPNPFNPATTIRYGLPDPRNIRMTIVNILGEEIIELYNGWQDLGRYEVIWNGQNNDGGSLASGIYFVIINDGQTFRCHKVMLLK